MVSDEYEYSILKTESERDELLKQINKLFPSRWYYDLHQCEPQSFFVAKENQNVVGYVRINTPNYLKIANSVSWYPLYPMLGGITTVGIFPEKRELSLLIIL